MEKTKTNTIRIKTTKKEELIDITDDLKKFAERVENGSVLFVYTPHTTAGITINESAGIEQDVIEALSKIVPEQNEYKHNKIDNNAAAHIKSSLIGCSKIIPIKNRKLELGTWQRVFFCEFDGPREREIILMLL